MSLEGRDMSGTSRAQAPIVIEVDRDNVKKDIEMLDIELTILTPRIMRDYKSLEFLSDSHYEFVPLALRSYDDNEEIKEIHFREAISGDHDHSIELVSVIPSASNVVGYLTSSIMKELRLFSGYHILYGKVKGFIENNLF